LLAVAIALLLLLFRRKKNKMAPRMSAMPTSAPSTMLAITPFESSLELESDRADDDGLGVELEVAEVRERLILIVSYIS
jgi:hypothetical protein